MRNSRSSHVFVAMSCIPSRSKFRSTASKLTIFVRARTRKYNDMAGL